MGRPRLFDEDEVVQHAMRLFWRDGFARTSMQDVVAAAGIGRQSLYATFGDKEELFARALDAYLARQIDPLLDALRAGGPVLPVVRAALRALAASAAEHPGRGCLLARSAAETPLEDEVTLRRVRTALARLERGYAVALARAAERGELRAGVDPAAAAALLLTTTEGMLVVGRVDADPRRLAAAADVLIDALAP